MKVEPESGNSATELRSSTFIFATRFPLARSLRTEEKHMKKLILSFVALAVLATPLAAITSTPSKAEDVVIIKKKRHHHDHHWRDHDRRDHDRRW